MKKLIEQLKIKLPKIWEEMDRTAAGMSLFLILFAAVSWIVGKIVLKPNLHILAYFIGGAIIIIMKVAIIAFINSIINFINNINNRKN
jgi:hypothetical protein